MTEQQREAFEAWYNEEYVRPIIPADRTEGGYQHPDAQAAWDAWQAALSHAEGEAVPVGYLSVLSDGTRIVDARQQYDAPEVWPIYTHPAPQVAEEHIPVPRALVEHWANVDAFQAPKGAAMELKTIAQQMLVNFDAKAPKTAPRVAVPEGYALVPVDPNEEMLDAWFTAPQGDSGSVQGFATAYRAMLAAAPAAPAGELVTRCTAGLGCDEKGYCDAAATGQGDLCDRRTMAHEQLVSDPDGLPGAPRPMSTAPRDGTMVRLLVQFTNHGVNDGFDSGPAWTIGANTYDDSGDDEWHIAGWDWQQDCFTAGEGEPLGWLPMLSAPAPDEREIGARRGRLS